MPKGAIAGTKAIVTNNGLKGGETLKLDGVTLRVHYAGHAHSDNDLMFEVVDDKALFFGDVVDNKYVTNFAVPQDASFKGSITAIKTMLQGPATIFIPGHGRTGGREVPEATLRFLEKLRGSVSKYYKQGQADYEMKDAVINEMEEYRDWYSFSELGRVITYVYQEVEKKFLTHTTCSLIMRPPSHLKHETLSDSAFGIDCLACFRRRLQMERCSRPHSIQ